MSNLKKVASLLLAGMLTSQSVTVDGGVQIVKAEEATAIEVPAKEVAAEEVLEIATLEQFKAFANRVNAGETFEGKTVRLVNDIAYDGVLINNFEPIGSEEHPFSGTFDGAGHSISGIIVIRESGCIFDNLVSATVENLIIKNCEFDNSDYSAGLARKAENCKIQNCHIGDDVKLKAKFNVAGVALSAKNTEIVNCSIKNITFSNSEVISGIVGNAENCNISNCKISEGVCMMGSENVAGIVDYSNASTIVSCENAAVVTGGTIAAGIVRNAIDSKIYGCLNKETIEATDLKRGAGAAAGIVAEAENSTINGCYNKGKVSAVHYTAGIIARAEQTNVLSSVNTGEIVGKYTPQWYVGDIRKFYVGGIIAALDGGNLYNCSNQANVEGYISDTLVQSSGTNYIGGLVGAFVSNSGAPVYIQNCFQSGTMGIKNINEAIIESQYSELIGHIETSKNIISNCYFLSSDQSTDNDGIAEGASNATTRNLIIKTATEMQSQEFLDLINKHRGSNTDWLPWVATSTYPTIKQCGVVMINNSVLGIYDEGTTVSFTITPTEGYQASSPLLNNGEVTYREDGDLTYSFSMPAGFVQIEYEEIKIEATPTPTIEVTATPEVQVTTAPNVTDTASPEGNATPNPTNTTTPTGDTTPVPTTVPTLAPTNTPAPIPMMEPVNNTLVLYVGGNTQQTKKYTTKVSNIKNYSISYESTKASVASVSSDGKITAKKAGTAVIYAHVKDKTSGKSYPFVLANVTVKKAGLSFSKKVTSLKVKKTATFKVKKNGIKGTVKWSVSNKKLASITSKGVLKAKKAGKVKVTAACGNKKATVSVTIKK